MLHALVAQTAHNLRGETKVVTTYTHAQVCAVIVFVIIIKVLIIGAMYWDVPPDKILYQH